MQTGLPVPPAPVFVPVNVQWYSARSPRTIKSSMITRISGNAVMNDLATSVIAVRPTAGAPLLIVSEPSGE